jgi:cytochrome bd ubiquinol oxidase subunit II
MSAETIATIWAFLIATAVFLYVCMDGFDLGVGILFPWIHGKDDRDLAVNTVAPVWDGNETWLILGGGGLFGVFPLAYATIMPAVYMPIIIMLLALIFRGVAFEFRWVAKPRQRKWDIAFAAGSTLAAFAQGLVLAAILEEIPVRDGQFAGAPFWWLSPFAVMCGLAVVAGYALLGAAWLMLKTSGPVEERARELASPLLLTLVAFIVLVSVWTPLRFQRVADRWFALPNLFLLAPVPIATALFAWLCWRGIQKGGTLLPFVGAVMIFLLAFIGLVVSNVPYLVPPTLTVWDAASHPSSQMFYLVGAAILVPMIIGYTVVVFYLFRGKLKPGEGYH